MSGQLDQISEAIGGLRARLDSVNDKIDTNRRMQDKRHEENTSRLTSMEQALALLTSDRRVAVIIISIITGAIMWVAGHFVTAILGKMGWK